ncbi:hypothetical protein ACFE04_004676 [Oxalis oulophora]
MEVPLNISQIIMYSTNLSMFCLDENLAWLIFFFGLGAAHDLDLNLGMSASSFGKSPKENEGRFPLQSSPYDMRNGRSWRMESPAIPVVDSPFTGLERTSNYPTFSNSAHPTFFSSEERGIQKKIELGGSSPQAFPSWAWQMHGGGGGQVSATTAYQMPLLSTAASSGFSFSAPLPSKPVNLPFNGLSFPSMPMAANSATVNPSQFYYQMKPPQAPP